MWKLFGGMVEGVVYNEKDRYVGSKQHGLQLTRKWFTMSLCYEDNIDRFFITSYVKAHMYISKDT